MNILFVSQYFYPAWAYGGPAVKVTAMSRELVRRGHRVEVLTSSIRADPSHASDGRPGTRALDGVLVHYLAPLLVYRGVSINLGAPFFSIRRIRPSQFDVVHIFGLYDWLGTNACLAARCRRVPLVAEPLGMYVAAERGYGRKWLYRRLVGDAFLRKADRVIATSEVEYDQLRSADLIDPLKLLVRRNGIDFSPVEPLERGRFRASLGLTTRDRVLLFLGRMAPIKQLETLIDAFGLLDDPRTHLVLVGPQSDRAYVRKLRALAGASGAAARIHFENAVEGARKREVFADADILVLPSRTESFGNAAAEAIVAGIPVVVTEGCGIATFVRDRVGLVCQHSAASLAASLRRLLADEQLYGRFAADCVNVRHEFAWDEPITLLESIYRDISTERAGSEPVAGRRADHETSPPHRD